MLKLYDFIRRAIYCEVEGKGEWLEGEVYVKRLQKDPVRRIIKLTSANPTHLDIELNEEELVRLRISGVIRANIFLWVAHLQAFLLILLLAQGLV